MARKSKLQKQYDELMAEYKRTSQRLDKQLYRLEKASQNKKEYKNLTKYAYEKMQKEIQNWSPGNTRWGRTVPGGKDLKQKVRNLQKKLNVMKDLEKLPSFSIKKMKDIYGRAAAQINRDHGTDFEWQDIADFYGSAAAEWMDSQYGSDTVVIALGKFKKMSDKKKAKLVEQINNNPNKRIDGDIAVSDAIKDLLKYYK